LSRYSKIASHQRTPMVGEVGSNDVNLRCKMAKMRSRALASRGRFFGVRGALERSTCVTHQTHNPPFSRHL
jgi:hypothetical protein